MARVEVIITKDGKIKYHVTGVKGSKCEETLAGLVRECNVLEDKKTDEWDQSGPGVNVSTGVSK